MSSDEQKQKVCFAAPKNLSLTLSQFKFGFFDKIKKIKVLKFKNEFPRVRIHTKKLLFLSV
jgi:hypothetical protein